jgi:hypothetical protein
MWQEYRMANRDLVANIGPEQRMRRVRFGVISLVLGAFAVGVLVALGAARPWRLVAFVPLWTGALGIFQAREKTCVALVARGERNMDAGSEVVSDPADLACLKDQARTVYLRSLLTAVALSAAALAIP